LFPDKYYGRVVTMPDFGSPAFLDIAGCIDQVGLGAYGEEEKSGSRVTKPAGRQEEGPGSNGKRSLPRKRLQGTARAGWEQK
jgi:hypothetical protein